MAKKKTRSAPAKCADLLIEIGCEDLPARYVKPLADALCQGVAEGLTRRGLEAGAAHRYATPRRIAVLVKSVPEQQPTQRQERTGPALAAALKDGKPTPAGLGFAKSCGVDFSQLGEKDGKLHFARAVVGQRTSLLLPDIFEEALQGMDQLVPKRMRWGTGSETFVRPVQWLVCLLGSKVVPLSRFGLKSSNKTFGHRFHAPKPIALKSPVEYEKKLKTAKVVADFGARREQVRTQIAAAARKLKGQTRPNDALLDEVTALVEWPVVITGRMDEAFMSLPPEVIIATIEHNQRYFPVFDQKDRLMPHFITISNIESRDKTQVVVGNERVVRPRLSDALFFWDQDRKQSLDDDFVAALDRVSFQQKLGSIGDKRRRISALSKTIAAKCGTDPVIAERAADLAKADLVSRMVFEFPELQGTMGAYYAKAAGEVDDVVAAIREHYLPNQSGGAIPSSRVGCIIALADKLDTMAGIFAVGQKPTASKDPYALRRAALGVLRILIEAELDLDLQELLRDAVAPQPGVKDAETLVAELLQFHWDRLRGYYTEAGVAVEAFEAVIATGATRPCDIERRLRAVEGFRKLPESEKLAAAHKRVRNILRQARERKEPLAAEVDRALAEPAEIALLNAMRSLQDAVAPAESSAEQDRYLVALKGLAKLQGPVDAFFEAVMVMAEDDAVRANRLALLAELDKLCRSVADISCLPG